MSTKRVRQWRNDNPERWKEHQRNYRKQHRKPCRYCGEAMPFPSPGFKYHRECKKAVRRLSDKQLRTNIKAEVFLHKTQLGCSRCGYNRYGGSLDWHHVDTNKERRLTIKSYFSPLGIAERNKCILLCANCHREKHGESHD